VRRKSSRFSSMNERNNQHEVVYQPWLESERGWGQRPDGYSIHLTLGDCRRFIEEYWRTMPSGIPDEYSAPAGSPQERYVDESIYLKLQRARTRGKYGLRFYTGRLDK
jgi:hypothetical protein